MDGHGRSSLDPSLDSSNIGSTNDTDEERYQPTVPTQRLRPSIVVLNFDDLSHAVTAYAPRMQQLQEPPDRLMRDLRARGNVRVIKKHQEAENQWSHTARIVVVTNDALVSPEFASHPTDAILQQLKQVMDQGGVVLFLWRMYRRRVATAYSRGYQERFHEMFRVLGTGWRIVCSRERRPALYLRDINVRRSLFWDGFAEHFPTSFNLDGWVPLTYQSDG